MKGSRGTDGDRLDTSPGKKGRRRIGKTARRAFCAITRGVRGKKGIELPIKRGNTTSTKVREGSVEEKGLLALSLVLKVKDSQRRTSGEDNELPALRPIKEYAENLRPQCCLKFL